MSARGAATYEALLFDPLAHMRLIAWTAVLLTATTTALVLLNLFAAAIVAFALSPAILMVIMAERGVLRVDDYGVRATLKPVVPLLPERRQYAELERYGVVSKVGAALSQDQARQANADDRLRTRRG